MRARVVPVLVALLLAPSTASRGDEKKAAAKAGSPFGDWTTVPAVVGVDGPVDVGPDSDFALREAVSKVGPGIEIRLASGTYALRGGNLTVFASGTAERWIAVRGPETGPPAILDFGGNGEFGIAGSYVLLEHVEVMHGGGNNVHITPRTETIHDVIVRDCRIHALSTGPGAAIKVNRNNAANAGVERIYLVGNDCSEAIGNALIDGVGVHQAVARGNHLHDNAKGSHGIFFKGGSSEILIEANLIRGIRGNAALQLGGNTGPDFFDPAHPDREGVDQLARNNLIVGGDDAIFEVRGVLRGRIDHNTVVTETGFAILRLAKGSAAGGGVSTNDDIAFVNNLVLSTSGSPQYARNDAGDVRLTFGPTLWGGTFSNSGSPGASIPTFPRPDDVEVESTGLDDVLLDPPVSTEARLAKIWADCAPTFYSPAIRAGGTDAGWVPVDARGRARPTTKPTFGALER